MQSADRLAPLTAINQVVPVGNDVSQRAAGVTEGHTAVHATRPLLDQLELGKGMIDLVPVVQPIANRTPLRRLARELHKPGRLTHDSPASYDDFQTHEI